MKIKSMGKTPHGLLHDALPAEYYALVMRGGVKDKYFIFSVTPHEAIMSAFHWSKSNEGLNFWKSVYHYLKGDSDDLPPIPKELSK